MIEIKQEVQQFYDQVGWQLFYDDISLTALKEAQKQAADHGLYVAAEERFPRFFGKIGKYPLITMRKKQGVINTSDGLER